MIDKLKFIKDNTENPKILEIISKAATLPEDAQEKLCECIEAGVFSFKDGEVKK